MYGPCILFVVALFLLLGFTACGSRNPDPDISESDADASETGSVSDGADAVTSDSSSTWDMDIGDSDYFQAFENPVISNFRLYFRGHNGSKYKIYSYDHDEIEAVGDGTSDYDSGFDHPVEYDSNLYFQGNNGIVDLMYRVDGTEIRNIQEDNGVYSTGFENPAVFKSRIIFLGRDLWGNPRLFEYDGDSIQTVSDILQFDSPEPPKTSSSPYTTGESNC